MEKLEIELYSKKEKNKRLNDDEDFLQLHLSNKTKENDKLKADIKELKNMIKENENIAVSEIRMMKNSIGMLKEENKILKFNHEQNLIQESDEKINLKKMIENMKIQLEDKEKIVQEKESIFSINVSFNLVQRELDKFVDVESRVEDLQKELESKINEIAKLKKYYQQKLETQKNLNDEQKKEWSNVYNELLAEIRFLKKGLDNIGNENKKLLSNVDSKRGYREY